MRLSNGTILGVLAIKHCMHHPTARFGGISQKGNAEGILRHQLIPRVWGLDSLPDGTLMRRTIYPTGGQSTVFITAIGLTRPNRAV
jgi:hypothetical protein